MKLLKNIYDTLTRKPIEEARREKYLKDKEANREYQERLRSGRPSKYDHAILCAQLKRNQKDYQEKLEKKLAVWNWLKKMI